MSHVRVHDRTTMQPTAEYPVPSILRIKSLDARNGGKRERGIALRAAVSALLVEVSVPWARVGVTLS